MSITWVDYAIRSNTNNKLKHRRDVNTRVCLIYQIHQVTMSFGRKSIEYIKRLHRKRKRKT